MNPIRHRSPKTQNNLAYNYFQSPKRRQINIINLDRRGDIINNKNIKINNQFNYNYNNNDYNYYDEIKKAFNFITFVLKQKDNQIKQLKIKINNLEKQLNEINEKNMMTFNNKEMVDSSPHVYNFEFMDNNVSNEIPSYDGQNKKDQLMNNLISAHIGLNNNNNIKNILKNNNKNIFDNNVNINNNKIKNQTNINKMNNYLNITDVGKKYNVKSYNIPNMNDLSNKQINLNINEHPNEKNNINKIRRESYHSNQNLNIRNSNNNGYIKSIKNVEQNNFVTDTESMVGTDRVKIFTFDNPIYNIGKPGSKSNSFNLSDDNNSVTSKKDVKNYLKEVKTKLEPERFKKFITNIKLLTKNKNSEQRNSIIITIKNLLADHILISKFENIMKIK